MDMLPANTMDMWQTGLIDNNGLKYRIQILRFKSLYLQRHIFYASTASPHLNKPDVGDWIPGVQYPPRDGQGFSLMDKPVVYIPSSFVASRNADRIDSEECGCCGYSHRHGFNGDCREDSEGFMPVDGGDCSPAASHYDGDGMGFASREAFAKHNAEHSA